MRSVIKGTKLQWIDVQNPTQEDLDFLKAETRLPHFVLEEIRAPAGRTKAEGLATHLFFILFYSVYNKDTKETRPRELDIILLKNTLITVHYQPILPLKEVFDKAKLYPKMKARYLEKGVGHLFFEIWIALWKGTHLKLSRINRKLDEIEEGIFKGRELEMLKEITFAKADIIDFWRIVEPQDEILKVAERKGQTFLGPQAPHYLADLHAHYEQAINDLRTYRETIRSLEETNNSLLTHKTNEIVKMLTVFSATLLPLTLIAAVFGMNTTLMPFTEFSFDFWIVMAIMGATIVGMFAYFRRKRWL